MIKVFCEKYILFVNLFLIADYFTSSHRTHVLIISKAQSSYKELGRYYKIKHVYYKKEHNWWSVKMLTSSQNITKIKKLNQSILKIQYSNDKSRKLTETISTKK